MNKIIQFHLEGNSRQSFKKEVKSEDEKMRANSGSIAAILCSELRKKVTHLAAVLLARKRAPRRDSGGLEPFVEELKSRTLTGILRVTLDACDGFIAFEDGVIVDAYEIFKDELLVKDLQGHHILERFKAEPGKTQVYEIRPDVLQAFVKTLQRGLPQDFQAWFSGLIEST